MNIYVMEPGRYAMRAEILITSLLVGNVAREDHRAGQFLLDKFAEALNEEGSLFRQVA